jgi:hypothetical protein
MAPKSGTATVSARGKLSGEEKLKRTLAEMGRAKIEGGRVSKNTGNTWGYSPYIVSAPLDPEGTWRVMNLDAQVMSKMPAPELMDLLIDVSPEVSKGLWDFLRMCNPGSDMKCYDQNGEVYEEAKEALQVFLNQLNLLYGSHNVVWNRLFLAAWVRGGIIGELVLDKRGRMPIDIATPDPSEFRFRQVDDEVRGDVWHLCQWQNGTLVDLDEYETIRYIPLDPMPGKPYGRPIAQASLFAGVFMIGLLHDLRRVIAQQGYPRLDIAVAMNAIRDNIPDDLDEDSEDYWKYLTKAMEDVAAVYASLEPDDAYVHPDYVTVNKPVGAMNAEALGAVGGLIEAIERILTRATKSMPLQMGITDSVSEANANRQWEMQVAGIKAVQHIVENAIEHWLTIALQVQGIVAKVEFRFAELRASEEMRDEQVLAQKIKNQAAIRDEGWQDQDEASLNVTGSEAVADAPVRQVAESDVNMEDVEVDKGAERAALLKEVRALRALIHPYVEAQRELPLSA